MNRSEPKRVAVLQSNYIPWRGYFDIIGMADEFIIYDEVQFTKNDWRNRNKIKSRNGLQWLTIPVGVNIKRSISQVIIPDPAWQKKHWDTLHHSYRKAPYFNKLSHLIAPVYLDKVHSSLSMLNLELINLICNFLGIQTKITSSSDYRLEGDRNSRLISLCKQSKAGVYLSGPSAIGYLDEGLFNRENIAVRWVNYYNYPVYPQLWGGFEPRVSILDLIFNTGDDAPRYMKFPC